MVLTEAKIGIKTAGGRAVEGGSILGNDGHADFGAHAPLPNTMLSKPHQYLRSW